MVDSKKSENINNKHHVNRKHSNHINNSKQSSSSSTKVGLSKLNNKNKNNNKKKINNNNNNNNNKTQDKGERYMVVITNVENDFAKVHQEAVPRFCCLNEHFRRGYHFNEKEKEIKKEEINNEEEINNKEEKENIFHNKRQQCRYTVAPRTETRSVEVSIYGKADGDISTVFIPATSSLNVRGNNNNNNNKKHNNNNNNNNNNNEKEEKSGVVECVSAPKHNSNIFATLQDMALALRHKPYFTHPPKFIINISGKSNGEILQKSKQRKRERTSGSGEEEKESEKLNNNDNNNNNNDNDELNYLHQSNVRQAEMITAVATTSTRMSTKDLYQQIKEIPGFITCWLLYPQHFRVVFANQLLLFKAKQLLDQFEVDGHVRVTLTLSDGAAKEFAKHIASVEAQDIV